MRLIGWCLSGRRTRLPGRWGNRTGDNRGRRPCLGGGIVSPLLVGLGHGFGLLGLLLRLLAGVSGLLLLLLGVLRLPLREKLHAAVSLGAGLLLLRLLRGTGGLFRRHLGFLAFQPCLAAGLGLSLSLLRRQLLLFRLGVVLGIRLSLLLSQLLLTLSVRTGLCLLLRVLLLGELRLMLHIGLSRL